MPIRNARETHRPDELPDELPDDPPRKRAHPLFWLLILLALFALGWSFYNHHAGESMPAPIRPDVTPGTAPRAQPQQTTPRAPPSG